MYIQDYDQARSVKECSPFTARYIFQSFILMSLYPLLHFCRSFLNCWQTLNNMHISLNVPVPNKRETFYTHAFFKIFSDPQNFCVSFSIRNMYLGFLSTKPIKILFIEAFLQGSCLFFFSDQSSEVQFFLYVCVIIAYMKTYSTTKYSGRNSRPWFWNYEEVINTLPFYTHKTRVKRMLRSTH